MEHSKTVAVLVDCDADGMTSAAVLINYLRDRHKEYKGPMPEIKYLLHEDKTHGLADTDVMRKLRDVIKPELLIIPDASGTQEQYDALVSLGIDIVVFDHHEDMIKCNDKHVIVVNNQQSENYRNKQLSGVGVVWQFCRYCEWRLE